MTVEDQMKTPIQLKVVTEIRDAGRKEMLSLEVDGILYEKDAATYIVYKEMIEGIGQITNTVKIKNDEVLIMRSGAVKMNHTYTKGATTQGVYEGPYGPMEMITKTENIDFKSRPNSRKSKLILAYQLQMQGESVGHHRITFMIEKNS